MSWTESIDHMLDECHAALSTCSVEVAPAPDGSSVSTGLPATPAPPSGGGTHPIATALVTEGEAEHADGSVIRTRTYGVRTGRTDAGCLPAVPQQGDMVREWRGGTPEAWCPIVRSVIENDGRSARIVVRVSRSR